MNECTCAESGIEPETCEECECCSSCGMNCGSCSDDTCPCYGGDEDD